MSGAVRGPVVVGALGGSGTRSLATALDSLGIYVGASLNRAHDNLWFTLLCKRPHWLPDKLAGERPSPEIVRSLRVLEALMTGAPLDRDQLGVLGEAAADMAAWGHDGMGAMADARAFGLAVQALKRPPPEELAWWGWKEPNSHLVLPELIATFPDLRYVHVLRHPLDMAYSGNKMQMRIWGPAFGIPVPDDEAQWPNAQLRWWLASTRRAVAAGAQLGERFQLLRFEEFCAKPARGLGRLCDAFGIDATRRQLRAAAEHVSMPSSAGRWRDHGTADLDPDLVREAGEYGFEVPATR